MFKREREKRNVNCVSSKKKHSYQKTNYYFILFLIIDHVELLTKLIEEDIELRLVLCEESLTFQLRGECHEPVCLAPHGRVNEDALEVPIEGEVILLSISMNLIEEYLSNGRVCAEGSSDLSAGVLCNCKALLLELSSEAEGEDVEVGDDSADKEVISDFTIDPNSRDDRREADKRLNLLSGHISGVYSAKHVVFAVDK